MIFPRVCPICLEINENDGICEDCKKELLYVKEPRCLKCGKTIDFAEQEYCFDCSRKKHEYTQGVSVWNYTPAIQKAVYEFKYNNLRDFSKCFAKEIKINCLEKILRWHAQALIPVPLHEKKKIKRGFNQSELIAEEFGKISGLRVDKTVIARKINTKPQKELNDNQRIKNLENAFILNKNGVKYKKVILVDDIYTTGATIDACAKVLKRAGVEQVYFITLCIGRGF